MGKTKLCLALGIQATSRVVTAFDCFGLLQVGLRYAGPIFCEEVVTDASGTPIELKATLDRENVEKSKCQGWVHWVSSAPNERPVEVEVSCLDLALEYVKLVNALQVRLYESLFTTTEPGETGDWLAELNPNSETVVKGYTDTRLLSAKPLDRFQFERVSALCICPHCCCM